jgi:hypothetical protein
MARALGPGGRLLLTFHIGGESLGVKELWGRPITMNFYLLDPGVIRRELEETGFAIEEHLEREPYSPKVEHQSRRAYLFARKPEE